MSTTVNADTTAPGLPMEWYFRLQPEQRVEVLDSLINNNGGAILAGVIEDDIQTLLGDTTSVIRFCTTSGITMTITHADTKKTGNIISGWKKKLSNKAYDKKTSMANIPAIEYDSIFPDSLSAFVFFYVKLPIVSRMHYFSDHGMSMHTDLTQAIVIDLNAITGCTAKPFIIYNGRPATDMAELVRCEVCWGEWLSEK